MAVSETFKLIVAVAIGALVVLGITHYMDLRNRAAVGDQRGTKIEATAGTIADGAQADTRRAERDTGTAQGAQQFTITMQEAERNEPATRNRADTPVPDSVRDAFRARRLARERSAGVQGSDAPGSR